MRLLLIGGFLTVCVCLPLGVVAILPAPPPAAGITKANFDRVEIGMARADVEGILGAHSLWGSSVGSRDNDIIAWLHWYCDDGVDVKITFVNDRVEDKTWTPSKETVLDRLRRWLHVP